MDDGCNEWDPWSLFLVACGLTLPLLEIYCMEKVWFRTSNRKITCVPVKCMASSIGWIGFKRVTFISYKNDKYHLLLVVKAIFCPYFIFFYKIIKEKVLIQIYLKLSCSNL